MSDQSHKALISHALYSAAQMRELDRVVIEEFGVSGYELMQRAGRFSYKTLKKTWPETTNIIVICGRGNNAGDGYVLAKLAIQDGQDVTVVNCFDPDKLKGDAKTTYQDLLAVDHKTKFIVNVPEKNALTEIFYDVENNEAVVVDAIFGTGLTRNIDDDYLVNIIGLINFSFSYTLSVDIPSGLNADTGNVMNVAVNADVTATFMGMKQGMLTIDGCEYSGQIVFDTLDIPSESYGEANCYTLSAFCSMYNADFELRARKRNSHKGNFGHVLVIGGDEGYLGAARLAAEAAMRVGSGLVSVATRKSHAAQLSSVIPEIMSHGVETLNELMPLIKRANVIAIGPGLGQSEWAKLLFARVLESDLPIIIDADALNLLAEEQSSPNPEHWIITPHPGEAARLLKTGVATIQSDRFQSAKMLYEKYHGPVVLKGAGSIVIEPGEKPGVCSSGNPGMSTGGMGDVLTGAIAGLVAQNIAHATMLGVEMHARAADMAARKSGERGMMATDLMPYLRELSNPYL